MKNLEQINLEEKKVALTEKSLIGIIEETNIDF